MFFRPILMRVENHVLKLRKMEIVQVIDYEYNTNKSVIDNQLVI
jgi:hypothetical protein